MLGSFVISLPESTVPAEFPRIEHVGGKVFNVAFRYRPDGDQPAVTSVYLAGSFNEWKPTAHRMTGPDKDGCFQTTLRLNAGHYEYKFVLNGTTWTHDPGNPNQNGPFNNSVVRVRLTKKQ
jgi:1,4-alpha-glucan branching enzyme